MARRMQCCGVIQASHAGDPGSTPGMRMLFGPRLTTHSSFKHKGADTTVDLSCRGSTFYLAPVGPKDAAPTVLPALWMAGVCCLLLC